MARIRQGSSTGDGQCVLRERARRGCETAIFDNLPGMLALVRAPRPSLQGDERVYVDRGVCVMMGLGDECDTHLGKFPSAYSDPSQSKAGRGRLGA